MGDHLPVSCTFDVCYQELEVKQPARILVRWEEEKKQSYKELIHRKLEVPPTVEINETNISRVMSDTLKQKIIETADELKLKKQIREKRVRKVPWFNSNCIQAKYNVRKSYRKWRRHRNARNFAQYVEAKKSYKKIIFETEKQYKKDTKEKLNNVKNSSEFWKVVKRFKSRRKSKKNNITKQMWENHLENLYNSAGPRAEIIPCDAGQKKFTEYFSISEIEGCVQKLKNNKAAGFDLIINELYKHLDHTEYLMVLFNNILDYETLPPDWGETTIFCMHKKGDVENPANYRGIALINTLTKLFTQLLHNRIYDWAEKTKTIPEEQAGFRKGRGCIDQIFILNCLIQIQLRLPRQKLYACFIDFKICFDGLSHDIIWQKLFHLGVAGKLIRILRNLYSNVYCRIRLENDDYTERVKVNRGLLQGDSASPLLFVLVVADLVSFMRNKGFSGVQISNTADVFLLMYADDLVLVGHSKIDLQKKINAMQQYCELNDLEVNIDKSKVVVFRRGGKLSHHDQFYYGTNRLDIVKTYTYLGVVFSSSGCFRLHMEHALSKAKIALANTRQIMVDSRMEAWESRMRLFETIVKVTLLYAGEVWALRYTDEMERCQVQFLKSILCLGFNTPNYYLRLEAGLIKLEHSVVKMALSWYIKVMNKPDDRYTKLCMKRMVELERRGGNRAGCGWFGQMKMLLQKRDITDEPSASMSRSEIEELLSIYANKLFSEDVVLLNASTFNPHFKHIKENATLTTEKYLLFRMPIERVRVISQLRTQGNSLCIFIKGEKYVWITSESCECCNLRKQETIEHLLYECPHYQHLRRNLNPNLHELLKINDMENAKKLYYFMSTALKTRRMIRNE
ncbi:hypothetical protein WDU94_001910 [Cyamophila willieti]